MKKYTPPKLERRAICITSDEGDAKLVAVVSSYFNESGAYLPIFKFPHITYSYEKDPNFEHDGFISKMVGNEARVLIRNALARFATEHVLLLVGLSESQKTYFDFVSSVKKIEINIFDEIDSKLCFVNKKFSGELYCNKNQLGEGLLLAKRQNKKLICNDKYPEFLNQTTKDKEGLVVIEAKGDISDIIAVNYAYAIAADTVFVEPVLREEIYTLQQYIYKWKKNNSYKAYKKIAKKVRRRIGYPNFSQYQYVTFFTDGLPYGAVLKNVTPFSHVFRSLREDFLIFNNILRERTDKNITFNSAVVFSPEPENLGQVVQVESSNIINTLESNKYFVKKLLKQDATVRNLDKYGGHYPYDLLHICSHGGETNGYYVMEKFDDRSGKNHNVEYEEVVGFSPAKGGLVQVFRKAIFRKFDGFKWMSTELKQQKTPPYVFEDMRKALFSEDMSKKALRVTANYPIYSSCHIQCFDSIHQGEFRVLASHSFPLVFNNTCSSWKEIATTMIAAGCRGYVGTLWSIKNKTALESAKVFYENLFEENIIDAFFEMIKSIADDADKNIYIYWGLHFESLNKPELLSQQRIIKELIKSFFAWIDHTKKTCSPEVRRNSLDIVDFIGSEIVNNFSPEDLDSFVKGTSRRIEEDLGKIKQSKIERFDEFSSRGIMDIPNENVSC